MHVRPGSLEASFTIVGQVIPKRNEKERDTGPDIE